MYKVTPVERYSRTLKFLKESLKADAKILDLGVDNPFSEIMRNEGWTVENTGGEDLDLDQSALKVEGYDCATAFEILEHTLNPLEILRAVSAKKMYVSIPMRYWFKSAYRSKTDMWDRHYHEFEDWQFEWLIEKAGWRIVRSEKWKAGGSVFGIRPFLRFFYDRYYLVEIERV
jgi:hypothetical protein